MWSEEACGLRYRAARAERECRVRAAENDLPPRQGKNALRRGNVLSADTAE